MMSVNEFGNTSPGFRGNLTLPWSVNLTQYHPWISHSHLPGKIDLWCLYLIDATIETRFTLEEIVPESS